MEKCLRKTRTSLSLMRTVTVAPVNAQLVAWWFSSQDDQTNLKLLRYKAILQCNSEPTYATVSTIVMNHEYIFGRHTRTSSKKQTPALFRTLWSFGKGHESWIYVYIYMEDCTPTVAVRRFLHISRFSQMSKRWLQKEWKYMWRSKSLPSCSKNHLHCILEIYAVLIFFLLFEYCSSLNFHVLRISNWSRSYPPVSPRDRV